MASRIAALGLSAFALAQQAVLATNTTGCKNIPSSAGWPSSSEWSQLNSTLGGRLLAPLPPAIVCDPTHHRYNEAACEAVGAQWFITTFHDEDPVSLHAPNWQKDGCLPTAVYNESKICNLQPFPKYTVNVSDSQDIVDAVKFASKHNIRLSVKNTGHDYLGRSTSPEFSIWTHHLKGVEACQSFQPQNCAKVPPSSALTIMAGNEMGEIYTVADANKVVVIGGADPSVGLGGWLTGGGHSPLSALHGLGVDNVLEMQMVTPSGDLITANECQNSDLFWAMRGGGGSTFGVLVSATLKTYQDLPASNFTLQWAATSDEASKNNNSNFYSILADMYSYLPQWSDNYLNGYFTFAKASLLGYPANTTGGVEPMVIGFTGYFHNKTLAEMHAQLDPFYKKLNATKGLQNIYTTSHVARSSMLLSTTDVGEVSGAGYNTVLGSRLFPKDSLTDREGLLKALRTVDVAIAQGLVVSGPGVRDSSQADMTSVTPAWRSAYLHTLVSGGWGYRNSTAAAAYRDLNTNVLTEALRQQAPGSGAYLNEADRNEPDYQQAFWGSNYARLLQIKRRYDPNGVFWCVPCVGHEDWKYNDATGQLCRA